MHNNARLSRESCDRLYHLQKRLRAFLSVLPFLAKPVILSYMKNSVKSAYEEALEIVENKCAYKDLSPQKKKQIVEDMLITCSAYGFVPSDYAHYQFENKTKKERAEYFSPFELAYMVESCYSDETAEMFASKAKAFERFRPFAGRAAFYLYDESQLPDCVAFLKQYPDVIVKPVNDYGGVGIRHVVVEPGNENETAEKILSEGKRFIEERIVQSEKMACLNESSVNTLRVSTFRGESGIELLHAALRVGRSGAVIDNFSAGGLFIYIDPETHRTRAKSKIGNELSDSAIHPDSGMDLSGFEVPDWDGMMELIRNVYERLPEDAHVVGWDLAYTDQGWVVIEINNWPGSTQEADGGQGKILRSLFAPYMKKKKN